MKFFSIVKISPRESSKVRLILFSSLLLSLLTALYYPLDLLSSLFPGLFRPDSSCIMLNVTGLPCPFCGMSRAMSEFMQFNFSKSIYYNPVSVFFFTFFGLFCLTIFVLSLFNHKISVNSNRKSLVVFVLIIVLMWVLNIFYGHH